MAEKTKKEFIDIKEMKETVEKYANRSDIWFYIGVAKYDHDENKKELYEKALTDRGIGKNHHKDDKMESSPYKIFYTNAVSEEEGYKMEKDLIDKYKDRKGCVNSKAGQEKNDEDAKTNKVILYLRLYKYDPETQGSRDDFQEKIRK